MKKELQNLILKMQNHVYAQNHFENEIDKIMVLASHSDNLDTLKCCLNEAIKNIEIAQQEDC